MAQIIGIGGPSCSGKSTVAHAIKQWLEDLSVSILHMDNFVYPESQIPRIKDRTDWETPASVGFAGLAKAAKDKMKSHDAVIAEGILIYANENLARLINKRIFVEIDEEEFFKRKKKDMRWNEPGNSKLFYMGAAGGGVWKTDDGGNTWKSISDGYFGG